VLGVCVKYGGAHEVVADGRRRRYPADSVSVRAPGCVWASEEGRYGFVSIDVAPALLPPDWAGAGMGFAATRELPGVAQGGAAGDHGTRGAGGGRGADRPVGLPW
jgi:hypothetical protein